ncbi:MAG TPA: CopD family protein [Acetobacteraceae bacterium]|nr:CopD family protein [Acetobacteraceae bacterium]
MSLLIDLFGYLSIVIHGLTITAQSMALGGVLFVALLLRPIVARLGPAGQGIERTCGAITAWSALALVLCEAATVALQSAVLIGTVDLSIADALHADFAIAGLVKATAAALIALTLFALGQRAPMTPLLALAAIVLAAATLTTHAAARLDPRTPLLLVEFLHQFGAAIWIGGIPCFLVALSRVQNAQSWRLIGARFSRMSMAGVACIVVSGLTMCLGYIGNWEGFYGTAYGVMVGAKIAMLLMLLGLGGGNFLLIERLRAWPATPVTRLKRYAEVEIGIGVAIFFAAASLTSVPPAIDLRQDRVTWPEIVERNTLVWPRFTSPDHDKLALPALQAKLDAEAAHHSAAPQVAFVPGSGDLPPRNAADIAWSEYNHHWAGLFVLAIGVLSLLHAAGLRWARHWPLLFLGLAVFLFLRSDPEVWPLGEIGFFASLRDIEVLQHRVFVVLIAAFAIFEWRVRTSRDVKPWARLVFPLLCAGGGVLLLTHSHAIANLKDQLLIELTHTPLALTGIIAGWARWLELRLDPATSPVAWRIARWLWPVCFVLVGLMLLNYREA